MQKQYCDFMDEISKEELYEGLLAYGLFTDKLPPIFTAVPFFDYCKNNQVSFSEKREEYITYHVMRNVGLPRIMGIPSPMKYQRLCSELSNYWDEIKKHFHEQTDEQNYRVSRIHIRKEKDSRQLFKMNYKPWKVDGNPELDLLIGDKMSSKYLVRADISTCFPSVYTHAIPWALVGKAEAKKNSTYNDKWYNRIDKACQGVKYGETHGLLIGPHASNLLAEIILTVVDRKLYNKGYRYLRNIDDFDCYVSSYEEAQIFLGDLENVLREFDLPLNHKKTKIIPLPIEFDKHWKHTLSDIPKFGSHGVIEYPQANAFIDTALRLAREEDDYAILNYAMKKLSNLSMSYNATRLAAKRFMHMAIIYPYLLKLMEDYVFKPYKIDTKVIKNFADVIYKEAEKVNDYESICYAIYFALKFDFELDNVNIEYVIKQQDCITLIITWLYYLKVNHGNRKATQLKPLVAEARALSKNEMGRYWLFCYEVLTKGLLIEEWKDMKGFEVSFIKDEFIKW